MCDTIGSDSWAEVSHCMLSFCAQRSHFAKVHLVDKAQRDVCSITNQILLTVFRPH